MQCKRCGAALGEGHQFCGDCGAPVGGCPACGEALTPGKRFCHACGFALADIAAVPAVPAPAVAAGPGLGREPAADRLSPERGSYGFAQEMLRQVAYDTLSRRDRKTRHLASAAHLRAAFPGDGEEVADVIARHYLDALAAVPDDRPLLDRAADLSPAEPQIRTPMVTAPGPEESAVVRDG